MVRRKAAPLSILPRLWPLRAVPCLRMRILPTKALTKIGHPVRMLRHSLQRHLPRPYQDAAVAYPPGQSRGPRRRLRGYRLPRAPSCLRRIHPGNRRLAHSGQGSLFVRFLSASDSTIDAISPGAHSSWGLTAQRPEAEMDAAS